MATIFTKIVNGEIPSYKVAESENYYAFLDISPLTLGHTLVVPKHSEEDYIFNLESDTYAGLWEFASRVAKALEKVVPCKRVGVAVLGMEVPHTHIHLVPLNSESDMDFRKTRPEIDKQTMASTAASILSEFNKLAQ